MGHPRHFCIRKDFVVDSYSLASMSEARLVHEVVGRHKLPAEFDRVQFEFGLDHTSDPALWLVFGLKPHLRPTLETHEALHAFTDEVRPELLEAGLERWIYARLASTAVEEAA